MINDVGVGQDARLPDYGLDGDRRPRRLRQAFLRLRRVLAGRAYAPSDISPHELRARFDLPPFEAAMRAGVEDPCRRCRLGEPALSRTLSREAATMSVVQLENEGDLLPLAGGRRRIAAIGWRESRQGLVPAQK